MKPTACTVLVPLLAAALGAGCGGTTGAPSPAIDSGVSDANTLVLKRPYNFKVPTGYDKSQPAPLVILLHGYGADGFEQDLYFRLGEIVNERGFLYAYPDGTPDDIGNRFWKATDACCDFDNIEVDDVAYVTAIIDDVERKYSVDPKRVFVVGHSNGGFMSHRLACDLSPRIAAIVSLAGAQWEDPTQCVPTAPISVLEVHGDTDIVVPYGGGNFFGKSFPGAVQTVTDWAKLEGCTGNLTSTGTFLDLDTLIAGPETEVQRVGGCPAPSDVELWTMHGDGHVPAFATAPAPPTWAEDIWAFFAAHPKP